MKTKILAVSLVAATAAGLAFLPNHKPVGAGTRPPEVTILPVQQETPKIEVVFVLDTTSSMSGMIQTAKDKIWSIASTMAQADPAPEIRMGLIAFRDRGDDYITRTVDLSDDLDSMYATLMDFRAVGGGDGPESVNAALSDAINSIHWSDDQDTYRVVFLVGDAPPHMDYQNDVAYPATIALAREKGIVVNAIQCGRDQQTQTRWTHIAQLGGGEYFQVDQSGGGVAMATPYDAKLAELSAELDGTRLYYGDAEEKAARQRKVDAAEKLHSGASVASQARRAAFNASDSGHKNFVGEGELVDDVSSGLVDLFRMDEANLPAPLQAMAPEEREAVVKETAERRDALRQEIKELSAQRDAFMKDKIAEMGGAEDSLDHKIHDTVRGQAAAKGIHYEADAVGY
ncbi:MAG: vWA domain-containing protein [Magnetospiraceae bacterium]